MMRLSAETLDDLLRAVYKKLLKKSGIIHSTQGTNQEVFGCLLELKNPRARLSKTETKQTLFSCLGELLWYLSRTDRLDFVAYYVPTYEKSSTDHVTVRGGYGQRMFSNRNIDQIANVRHLLSKRRSSRRAAIQIFEAEDSDPEHLHVPCTCTLQFAIRNDRLHMVTFMRSNDAFLGLPHDVFAFTMIQEVLASSLNLELGTYQHMVGSLHLYEKNAEAAKKYVDEGWQPRVEMPKMPSGDPWPSIHALLEFERAVREEGAIPEVTFEPYWADLARLLRIFGHYRFRDKETNPAGSIEHLRKQMHSPTYDSYIASKLSKTGLKPIARPSPVQMTLPLGPVQLKVGRQ